MSIKIKIQDGLEAKQSCEKLLKKTFKAKTSFKLLQLQKELLSVEENFNQIKEETIKKYATKDDNGEPITETLEDGRSFISVDPEKRLACTAEIAEALTQEIEIKEINFNLEVFGDETITGEDLLGIFPFINE